MCCFTACMPATAGLSVSYVTSRRRFFEIGPVRVLHAAPASFARDAIGKSGDTEAVAIRIQNPESRKKGGGPLGIHPAEWEEQMPWNRDESLGPVIAISRIRSSCLPGIVRHRYNTIARSRFGIADPTVTADRSCWFLATLGFPIG